CFFVFVVLPGKAPRNNRPAATQISRSPIEKAILSWAVKAVNGLSMSIQGNEVAKETSDIIILDDSLASVVKVTNLHHMRDHLFIINQTVLCICT
ncbi:hypothetical protein S245_004916, partial [Arachis hypogaea]